MKQRMCRHQPHEHVLTDILRFFAVGKVEVADAEHIGGVLIIEPGKVRGVIPHIWYRLIRIIQPLCGGG